MSELYIEVNQQRVMCGRCRHEQNQEQIEGGQFDSEAGLTFHCNDCHAVYAVCRRCAWFMSNGIDCARCADNPAPLLAIKEGRALVPKHIREANLVPDPGGRSGHWHDPVSGDVISMPLGWKPSGVDAPDIDDNAPEDLTGKSVVILVEGPFYLKKGVVSESGLNEDELGISVIEEGGQELHFECFEPHLRFMTPEEELAAKAEAEAARAGASNDPELKTLISKTQAELRALAADLGVTVSGSDSKPKIAAAILAHKRGQ